MTLACNCDMPIDIYCDWLQDQGWDCEELRADEEPVADYSLYANWYEPALGEGWYVAARNIAIPYNRGDGITNEGDGCHIWGSVMYRGNSE